MCSEILLAQLSNGKLALGGIFDELKINLDSYTDIIKNFNNLDLKLPELRKDDEYNWDAIAESIEGCDETALSYFKTLDDGNGTINNQSASVEGLGAYLKATGQSFNFAAIKATLLNTALNAGIFLVASLAIQAVIKGLDHFINRAKYAKEAMEAAQQAIDDSQSKLKEVSTILSENKDRFLELSDGVSRFSKNISLSEEDYAEYLSISQKLADISPSLVSGYDEQGNALIDIGNNAEETTAKLNELLKTQQDISKQTLIDNLDAVAQGIYYEVSESKGDITQLEQELNTLKDEASEINFDIADIVKNSNGIFQFTDASDPFKTYRNAFIKALESANIGWEDLGNDQILVNDFSKAVNNGGRDGYEIRNIALKEAQDYYNAMLNLEDNVHAASITGLEKELSQKENAIKTSYAKMTANLQAWAEGNYNYQYLSDTSQTLVDALIPQIDWNSLGIDLSSGQDYQNYINDNILIPLMSVKPEDRAEIEQTFSKLLSFKDGDLDVLPFAEQLQNRLKELNITIDIAPIIANEQDAKNKLQLSVEKIAKGSDYYTAHGNQVDAQELLKLQEFTADFTAEQIELWNKVTLGIVGTDNAIQAYQDALADANNKNPISSLSISQTIDQLNTQVRPALDSLKSAWQDIFTDDGTAVDTDSMDILATCDSIKSRLDEMSGMGLDIDYSAFEDLVRVLNDSEPKTQDVKDAFNALAASITQAGLSGTEDFETMRSALEDLGVANSEMATFDVLISNTEALKEAGLDLAVATDEQLTAFVNELVSVQNCDQALALLQLRQIMMTENPLETMESVRNILALAQSAGISGGALSQLEQLKPSQTAGTQC